MKKAYGDHYESGEKLINLVDRLWQNEEDLTASYKRAKEDCAQFLKDIKITK